MNKYVFIVVVVMFLAALPAIGWAIGEPVGPATVPPSSISSGLIRSPNPIDTSTNLVITGNIRSGRHFRGVVPYTSTMGFSSPLGTSSLDSFLRYSAGSEDFGRFSGRARPYYSATGTVTITTPGHPGVIRPPVTSFRTHAVAPDVVGALSTLPGSQVLSGTEAPLFFRRLRPLSMTLHEIQRQVSSETDTYIQQQKLTAQQRFWIERYKQELKKQEEKKIETVLEKDLLDRQIEKADKDVLQPFKLQVPTKKTDQEKQIDIYEQMLQRIHELQEAQKELPAAEKTEEPVDDQQRPSAGEIREDFIRGTSVVDELSGVDLAARASAILGPYESFAAFSQDKFNQNMRAAEDYLKQGKYYRAVDAYTLALLYKPNDPLAYAGKSHALFVAGEYLSSALFLSRALEIFPEYAAFEIDIVAMVGDRDALETRVVDAEQWLQRSDAVELHFLLAYIYYRMGRFVRANEAINAAYEKMPEATAVIALKKAIEAGI